MDLKEFRKLTADLPDNIELCVEINDSDAERSESGFLITAASLTSNLEDRSPIAINLLVHR